MITMLLRDMTFGLRSLRKSLAFTFVCVLTLAIGIGSSMAMFSLVDSVLIDAPPITHSRQIVNIWTANTQSGADRGLVSQGDFVDWKSQSSLFEDMGTFSEKAGMLTGFGEPRRVFTQRVSPTVLRLLGATPELGRLFGPDEEQPAAQPSAIISHVTWKAYFAGAKEVLGRKIELDGVSYTIIGVLNVDFWYPRRGTQIWTSLPLEASGDRATRSLRVVGRLREGSSPEQAQQELASIARSLEQRFPATNQNLSVRIETIEREQQKKTALLISFAMGPVVILLLIACINVTNLLLARGFSRQVEFATRAALGASRWRLLQQQFAENLCLAIGGACLGTALALLGIGFLRNAFASANPSFASGIRLSGRVLGFGCALTALLPLVFGIIPAVHTIRGSPGEMLKQAGAGASARFSLKRLPLSVLEVAMATILLLLNILFSRSMINVEQAAAPGIETNQLFTLTVETGEHKRNLDQLVVLLAQTPGVSSAGIINQFPLLSSRRDLQPLSIEQSNTSTQSSAVLVRMDKNMFTVLGLQTVQGQAANVSGDNAIISERFARTYGQNILGSRVRKPGDNPYIVTAVVRDWLRDTRSGEPLPTAYLPLGRKDNASVQVVVRSGVGRAVITSLAATVHTWDPTQAIGNWQTVTEDIEQQLTESKRVVFAVGSFAFIAIALSCIGVYSIMNYSIARRTRDMGIRMALGATRKRLFTLVLREALVLTSVGLAIGWLLGVAAALVVAHELVGVSPLDFLAAFSSSLIILASCCVASYLPARRASRVDPLVAVRFE